MFAAKGSYLPDMDSQSTRRYFHLTFDHHSPHVEKVGGQKLDIPGWRRAVGQS
jgi:hypothetical protein